MNPDPKRRGGRRPTPLYREKILQLLRAAGSEFLSGETLARKAGISRTMVWKHVQALEREGFGIAAVPSRGYRIVAVPDLLRQPDITSGLGTRLIGREVQLLPKTSSTNTLAMELAAQGAPEGTVVVAETQTAGRGRRGRTWISPKGNLYMSAILRPDIPVQRAPRITLLGAVAVAAAVRKALGLNAVIKWPNDVLIKDRKVCGLLTEMSAEQDRVRHVVLGIGVDVNADLAELPSDVQPRTTTLAAEAGKRIDRTALLREVLRELDQYYRAFLADDGAVLAAWKRMNCTLGNRVEVSGAGATIAGRAQDIDGDGRLVIRTDDGAIEAVSAGDVTIVKRREA